MKKIKNIILIAIVAMFTTACSIIMPVAVTENPIGSKKGVSKSIVLFGPAKPNMNFGIYLNSNYGLEDACKNGKITGGISTIDEKTSNMIFFTVKELIVTGE